MGTKGLFGFFHKGKYYVVHNLRDSFPGILGVMLVTELKKVILEGRLQEWLTLLLRLKIVDGTIPPTSEDLRKIQPTHNSTDWYDLLFKDP